MMATYLSLDDKQQHHKNQQKAESGSHQLSRLLPRTLLAIQVLDLRNGADHLWSLDKFKCVFRSAAIQHML